MVKTAIPSYTEEAAHSQPFARHQIPAESETRMRKFLQEAMPQIANFDFSFARVCRHADTVDRQFLIDRPKGKSGLVLAAGGLGMGFMMMPVVGQLIVDRMEGVMEERLQKGLRRRPEQAVGRDWQASKYHASSGKPRKIANHDSAVQDRHGGEGKIMEFHNAKEWTSGKGDNIPNTEMELAKDSKTCNTM